MPKASKATASESMTLEGYEGHFEHFEGGYSVGFETYTADADLAPLFVGLPDDRCQCPHWGYVIKGKVKFTFTDGHEETYEARRRLLRAAGAHAPRSTPAQKSSSFIPQPNSARRWRSSRRTWRRWARSRRGQPDERNGLALPGRGVAAGRASVTCSLTERPVREPACAPSRLRPPGRRAAFGTQSRQLSGSAS